MKQEKITPSIREIDVQRKWYLVDAENQILGRLASNIARILRGKHKPYFTPHVDCGDFVVVINADKVKLTGKREELKTYFRYSGYPDGAKITSFKEYLRKKPEFIVEHAVKGMIPHNRLGRRIIKKLKVYKGSTHPHRAQKPEELKF
ncbi:MAG: 50S ribosomal protein L13 [Ignavibacteria bacterium]|nr:50S ribosomal protein L13 [Ignavibacteria bacterium]